MGSATPNILYVPLTVPTPKATPVAAPLTTLWQPTVGQLESIELVDPQGRIVEVDQRRQPDLFWACRGGGGGSFGAATRFRFNLHKVDQVVTFVIDWVFAPDQVDRAVKAVQAWQAWAPRAPKEITSILRMGTRQGGRINVHCNGWSVGSAAKLRQQLKALPDANPSIQAKPFLKAVDDYSGGWCYESTYSKCKSDYVVSPLSDAAIRTLIDGLMKLPAGAIVPICDAYGGAVADVAADATAFAHRAGTLYCIQYYSSWDWAADTAQRVEAMRTLYASMRPYVSGGAYVNYCDLDLGVGFADAYWGANLPRLRRTKGAFDPDNVFQHAQSVPPA